MNYKSTLTIVFLIIQISAFCQNGKKVNHQTSKADSCFNIGDYDCALTFYQNALSSALSHSDTTAIRLQMAKAHYMSGQFDLAYDHYNAVLNLTKEAKMARDRAVALEGLSHIWWRSGDNVQSISSIIESIRIFTQLADTSSLISASNILGGIYVSIGNLKEAEEIYSEMLNMAIAANDSVNIASNYEYIGVVHFFNEKYQKAIEHYEKALSINLITGRALEAGINYGNIGEAYGKLEDLETALSFYNKAVSIQRSYGFNSGLIFLYYSIGETHTALNEFSKGLDFYHQSLQLMDKTGEVREKSHVYKLMAENYERQQNFRQAYKHHQLYAIAKDSVFNIEKNKQLEEIKAKYDIEKREQENYFLARENETKTRKIEEKQAIITGQYILGGLLLVFLSISVYLSVRLYKNKNQLSRVNATKDKIFGFIAHDLKGPMGNIKSLADLLADDLNTNIKLEDHERREFFHHLQNSTNTVLVLLNDLLAWSMTQQQGFDFKPEDVNVYDAVKECVDLFETQIKTKSLSVVIQISPELYVFVDPGVIRTIFRNFLSNATKFTNQDGKIGIDAKIVNDRHNQSMVEITVADNGIGMSEDQAAILLAGKEIISTMGTANEKGSGLGFNIIREFVKASNGKIKIESQPQKGTKFFIYLPSGTPPNSTF